MKVSIFFLTCFCLGSSLWAMSPDGMSPKSQSDWSNGLRQNAVLVAHGLRVPPIDDSADFVPSAQFEPGTIVFAQKVVTSAQQRIEAWRSGVVVSSINGDISGSRAAPPVLPIEMKIVSPSVVPQPEDVLRDFDLPSLPSRAAYRGYNRQVRRAGCWRKAAIECIYCCCRCKKRCRDCCDCCVYGYNDSCSWSDCRCNEPYHAVYLVPGITGLVIIGILASAGVIG